MLTPRVYPNVPVEAIAASMRAQHVEEAQQDGIKDRVRAPRRPHLRCLKRA